LQEFRPPFSSGPLEKININLQIDLDSLLSIHGKIAIAKVSPSSREPNTVLFTPFFIHAVHLCSQVRHRGKAVRSTRRENFSEKSFDHLTLWALEVKVLDLDRTAITLDAYNGRFMDDFRFAIGALHGFSL
jgi:hypothetical protein